jgi:hypothetical protein
MQQSSFKRARLKEISPRRAAFRRLLTDKWFERATTLCCLENFLNVNFKAPARYFEIGLATVLALGVLVKGAEALSIDRIVAVALACDQGGIVESDGSSTRRYPRLLKDVG